MNKTALATILGVGLIGLARSTRGSKFGTENELWWHGSIYDFDSFKNKHANLFSDLALPIPLYFSKSKKFAEEYADGAGENQALYRVRLHIDNTFDFYKKIVKPNSPYSFGDYDDIYLTEIGKKFYSDFLNNRIFPDMFSTPYDQIKTDDQWSLFDEEYWEKVSRHNSIVHQISQHRFFWIENEYFLRWLKANGFDSFYTAENYGSEIEGYNIGVFDASKVEILEKTKV